MPFKRKAIILLVIVLFKESDGYCPTAKEGETVTFQGTFTHTFEDPVEIIWSKEGIVPTYSKCNHLIVCRDSENKTQTSLVLKGNNVYKFSFQIKNVTKNDFGLWKLMYSGVLVLEHGEPLYTCNLEPTIMMTNKTEQNKFALSSTSEVTTFESTTKAKESGVTLVHYTHEKNWLSNFAGPLGGAFSVIVIILIAGVYLKGRKREKKVEEKFEQLL
ncbi:uncharacterized protein LOC106075794 [Biomphalaria glabrata]|uniref:Uncharacterized protein LOC106075794 n=1 Tax=Biomphalaria glabrata TaxID=6526 RepID=A0A9W2YX43_BIOGL|nr:uncharacterized protein LOC106075794 [Biomphalaria glabrata]XP_055867282.1 uncharacterized protein LOC106075794 [Biomphalaria glabrata]